VRHRAELLSELGSDLALPSLLSLRSDHGSWLHRRVCEEVIDMPVQLLTRAGVAQVPLYPLVQAGHC